MLSVEQSEHLGTRLHGVDHQVVAAVENENDSLKQSTVAVEAESKLSRRAVVVEVLNLQSPGRGLCCIFELDPVL